MWENELDKLQQFDDVSVDEDSANNLGEGNTRGEAQAADTGNSTRGVSPSTSPILGTAPNASDTVRGPERDAINGDAMDFEQPVPTSPRRSIASKTTFDASGPSTRATHGD
jgi:hypothetical protein